MICFQNTLEGKTLIINHKEYKIYNQEHYKQLLFLFDKYCSIKAINIKKLAVIFHGMFHILFRYQDILIKLVYNDFSNIEDQYILSQKSTNFGKIHEIFTIPNTNSKIITFEYISNLFDSSTIFNQKCPFIFLYSMTIDYLKSLNSLHKSGYIHSSIKPIYLMVSIGDKTLGKLVGLDDITKVEKDIVYYYNTSGAINYLAPERYEYFENYGFFGMTSFQSDIWELFFSILNILDIIILNEFLELYYNNFEILESYLLNKIVKRFSIDTNNILIGLADKYIKTVVQGLKLKGRPDIEWYIHQLIGYKEIIDK